MIPPPYEMFDIHLSCDAYPNCDEDPEGCSVHWCHPNLPEEIPVYYKINSELIEKFITLLPYGHENAIGSKKLAELLSEKYKLKGIQFDSDNIRSLSYVSLWMFLIPIGTWRKGRYLMINEEDRRVAIDFIQSFISGSNGVYVSKELFKYKIEHYKSLELIKPVNRYKLKKRK
jgi:hypothetical protein